MLLNRSKIISFSKKHTPRWVVFQIDIFICVFSFFAATVLHAQLNVTANVIEWFINTLPIVLIFRIGSFVITKNYRGIIRYTSTWDAIRIFTAITASSIGIFLFNYFYLEMEGKASAIPNSIIIIDYINAMLIMTASRLTYKILYLTFKNPSSTKNNVIIYGAGESAIITKRTLDQDGGSNFKILAFIDDDKQKVGKTAEGIPIYNASGDFEDLLKRYRVDELIISIQNISISRKQEIIETCLSYNIKVRNVPPVEKWINGELSTNQIKTVKIEDLLERETIELDKKAISGQIDGKVVLITGAAGSIGSEIANQVMSFNPSRIVLLDQAETPLYDLEISLIDKTGKNRLPANVEIVVGDIRNQHRMTRVFDKFKPDYVYHAAAYKHVPLMENNPSEAVLSNILGTKVLADLSVKYKVEKFVMISTDKAVNPTSIMGASKRIAEIYVQSLSNHLLEKNLGKTKFITTRFGNVLGSNGSVIPLFRKQIAEGGPITVTHPEITRYFMTIPEACQLVLEAGAIGDGGEIFIFDMGESVKIVNLANKMIKLSGLTLGKDIQIVFTGLRPGEKLKEELLNDKENTVQTHHPKIMIAKVRSNNFETTSRQVDDLIDLFNSQSNEQIVKMMKVIVPEYISNNSIFQTFDEFEQVS